MRTVDCTLDHTARHDLVARYQRLRQARRGRQRSRHDAGLSADGVPAHGILHGEGRMSASSVTPVMLPSRSALLKRLGGALLAALAILLLFVMPAEYQIDPTGFGKLTGLVKMSQTVTAPQAAAPTPVMNTTAAHTYTVP